MSGSPDQRAAATLARLSVLPAQDNDIGRAQGCTAAFNGIMRQLRGAGRDPNA